MTDIVARLHEGPYGKTEASINAQMREAADEIERLRAELDKASRTVSQNIDWEHDLEIAKLKLEREIKRLRVQAAEDNRLTHEWMRKHDRLLGFIQKRPAMLKELIESEKESTVIFGHENISYAVRHSEDSDD